MRRSEARFNTIASFPDFVAADFRSDDSLLRQDPHLVNWERQPEATVEARARGLLVWPLTAHNNVTGVLVVVDKGNRRCRGQVQNRHRQRRRL